MRSAKSAPPAGYDTPGVAAETMLSSPPRYPALPCWKVTVVSWARSDRFTVVFVPPVDATMLAALSAANDPAVAVNETDVVPAGIVTDAGTDSGAAAVVTVKTVPPAGANFVRVSEQVVLMDGPREVGVQRIEVISTDARRVTPADAVLPLREAVTVALVSAPTDPTLMLKIADTAPAGTTTEA